MCTYIIQPYIACIFYPFFYIIQYSWLTNVSRESANSTRTTIVLIQYSFSRRVVISIPNFADPAAIISTIQKIITLNQAIAEYILNSFINTELQHISVKLKFLLIQHFTHNRFNKNRHCCERTFHHFVCVKEVHLFSSLYGRSS